MACEDRSNSLKAYYERMLEDAKRAANSYYGIGIYRDMDVASLYPETELITIPQKKLFDFCSDNNILFEAGNYNGIYTIAFLKFGVSFRVTFDSYRRYLGLTSDDVDAIIKKLTAVYKCPGVNRFFSNSLYGMSTGNPIENAVLKYCEEDVKATMEMTQFHADFTNAVKKISEDRLKRKLFGIKNVIFNNPATIVLWNDNTKTVVKCQDGDDFDKEKGLAMAICKKALGTNASHSNFNDIFKKWITED